MFFIIYSCAIEVSETTCSDTLDNFVNLITNNWILDSFNNVMVTQLHFKLHICQSTEKKQSIKTLLIGGYPQCSKGRGEMDYSVSVFIIRKFL